MLRVKKAFWLGVVLTFVVIGVGAFRLSQPVYAASADIIINELMYNPSSGNEADEYLELYNTTDDTIDISNWCFTAGITLCFNSGTSLPAHSYGLISPDSVRTQSTYGQSTIGTYTGALSNGGETVTLSNESSQVVNSVTYDDAAPWPVSPDGSGPSLELKDPELDNSLAASWGASVGVPTPGAENSLVNLSPPNLSNITKPAAVDSSDEPLITVAAQSADSVELVYKVMFNAEQTIAMVDDGTNGDQVSGDGIYSARIPQQSPGNLVRYKVTASNADGGASLPSSDDSIHYYGYVVRYDVQPGALPRLEWFIADDDYDDLNNSGTSNEYFPAVISYGDTVIDNVEIRLKGNYSRTFPKKPYKVKLPKGYSLSMPEVSEYPLKEFHLNSDFPNGNFYISSVLSWQAFRAAGFQTPQFRKMQLQRNGQFEGAYLLADKYDDEWQDQHPRYKTGDMYDAWWEDHNPGDNDTAARDAWRANSLNLTGDDLHKYVRDNYDIPNIVNFLAVSAVIRHHDWSAQQNLITYLDSPRTQRWSVYPWDLDLTFNESYGTMIDPTETPDYLNPDDRFFAAAIWNDPELKSMYLRRVTELADQLLKSGQIAQWAEDDWNDVKSAAQLDFDKWYDQVSERATTDAIKQYIANDLGLDPDSPEVIAGYYQATIGDEWVDAPDPLTEIAPLTLKNRIYFKFTVGISRMTKISTEDLITSEDLPDTQPHNARVLINEIMYNPPGGDSHEYIELYNPNTYAVDISDWSVEGVSMTLPPGSVLSAKGYAILVKNDKASRQQYGGGVVVLGEYDGKLSNTGETITLTRTNNTVSSSVTYLSNAPWPEADTLADKSLERVSENCWAASGTVDGSPGRANSPSSDPGLSICTNTSGGSGGESSKAGPVTAKQDSAGQSSTTGHQAGMSTESAELTPNTGYGPERTTGSTDNQGGTTGQGRRGLLAMIAGILVGCLYLYKLLDKHKRAEV